MSRIKLNVCKKLGYLFQGGLEAFLLEVDISLAYAACSLHLLNLVLLFGCIWNQVEKHLVGLSEIIASFLKALVRFGAIFFHLFKRLTSLVHHPIFNIFTQHLFSINSQSNFTNFIQSLFDGDL